MKSTAETTLDTTSRDSLAHVQPIILAITTLILTYRAVKGSTLVLALIALEAPLAYKLYRTWIMTQLYLAVTSIRNLRIKEIA